MRPPFKGNLSGVGAATLPEGEGGFIWIICFLSYFTSGTCDTYGTSDAYGTYGTCGPFPGRIWNHAGLYIL